MNSWVSKAINTLPRRCATHGFSLLNAALNPVGHTTYTNGIAYCDKYYKYSNIWIVRAKPDSAMHNGTGFKLNDESGIIASGILDNSPTNFGAFKYTDNETKLYGFGLTFL